MSTDVRADDMPSSVDSNALGVRGAKTAFTDYASVLGARFSSVLLSLVTIAMSSRILGPAGYAVVAYVALISGLVFAVTSAWTAAAVSRYGREELETGGRVGRVTWARATIAAPLLLLCIGVVVGLELAGALPRQVTWRYIAVALAGGVFMVTAEHTIALVEVYGKMKLSALWIVLGQVVVAIGLATILIVGRARHPFTVVALIAGAQIVITAALASRSWKAIWPPVLDRAFLRRVLVFSAPLAAFTFSQYVVSSADIVAIQAYRRPVDVGVYAVAYRGYTVLQSLSLASGPVLIPLFVSLRVANHERVVRLFVDRAVAQLSVVGSVLTGVAAAAVGPAIAVVVGHSFRGSAAPLEVLLLANVAYFMANLLGAVLVLYERTRAVAVINLGAAAINVTADVLLIGVFGVGIVGAAIATTIAIAFVWLGYLLVARSSVGLPLRINPLVFAPAAIGVVAPLAHAGVGLICIGEVLSVVVGVVVLRIGALLVADDVVTIAALDIPPGLKRIILKATKVLAR